jgi:predicted nucleic acid-binding Zn ribbon protein
MNDFLNPTIDLKKQPTVVCEKCNGITFKEVTLIKKVPKLLLGSKEDTIVPFPTYKCDDCGHMNEEFRLFDDNNKTNLV